MVGTVDFDPGAGTYNLTSVGDADAYVLKLNSGGNFVWAETFGGTGDVGRSGITIDASGTLYLAGSFQNTVDFNPDPDQSYEQTNDAFADLFLLKLAQG
jgi:hypothetical protein